MIAENELPETKKIIEEIISRLKLNLSGLKILTEAGSNYYLLTPVIAAMAGAEKIFVWTKDSSYGNADKIISDLKKIIFHFHLENKFIFSSNKRDLSHVREANIITNLGFIRPINKKLLSQVNPQKTVIPLMYDKWELRKSDIDIAYCRRKKIKVGGTWENHPDLQIFSQCGKLALQMAKEAGFPVVGNKIILWSDDDFGEVIEKSFLEHGALKVVKTVSKKILYENIPHTDFIFFADYSETRSIISKNGFLSIKKILHLNKKISIVHLYGKIDNTFLKKNAIHLYPDKKGKAKKMTFTLAHIGMKPLIHLNAAGLKVGECLLKNIENPMVQTIV